MKKRILIPTLAAAVCGGTVIAIAGSVSIKNASAELNLGSDALIAANNTLSSISQVSSSKDETVYVITDADGSVKTKFIGNTIYTGSEELPFDFKITYYLDGNEISAKDLSGKSGHVKIVYRYNSTAMHQGKYVPFMAVTGVTLDSNKFKNVKIENGKVISETADNYVIAGYSLTGLDKNLGTNLLSDSFTLEADVTNFALGNTYTMFMNDIFADLDTSKLSDLDSLTNSMTELSDGVNKIIDGAGTLSNGLADALNGAKTLYAGSEKLTNGLAELESHNGELVAGAEQLVNMTPTISSLISEKVDSLKAQLQDLETKREALEPYKTIEPYATQYAQVVAGIEQVTAGISQLAAGAEKLSSLSDLYDGIVDYTTGVSSALTGSEQLTAGLGSLVEGETKLYDGSITLKDGLNTLKTTGIDKLVNFATNDVKNFTSNLRSTVSAAGSYRHYGDNTNAKSVKFILKTASI